MEMGIPLMFTSAGAWDGLDEIVYQMRIFYLWLLYSRLIAEIESCTQVHVTQSKLIF